MRLDESLADAWVGLGMAYTQLGQHKTAMMHVEKAIKIETSNPEYFYILGDIQLKLGLSEKALASYYMVAKLEPADHEVWLDIAEIHENNNNLVDAIAAIQEGLEKVTIFSELNFKLAELYVKSGNMQEAYEAFAQGVTNDPTDLDSIMADYPIFSQHHEFQQIINIYLNNKT